MLLTACMVFSAGQSTVYAANEPDQAEENAILSEDGETRQPIENIQEEGSTYETAAPVEEDTLVPEVAETDLNETPVGDGEIPETIAADRDDFLAQYRALLVQRADRFRLTVPLEAKMTSLEQYTPSSVVFNDQDPDSWENSDCFYTGMPAHISIEG